MTKRTTTMTTSEQAFLSLLSIGVFSIDAQGRIWRHRRMTKGYKSHWKAITKCRAERSKSDGYPTVMFCNGSGVRYKVFAHRVVWMVANQADIPEPLQINHKDGRRGNTLPSNLECVTPSGNAIHAIRVLGRREKVSPEHIVEIRELCETMAQSEIAKMFSCPIRTIGNIHTRRTFKHVS